jgi:hypothetical protein
VSVAFFLFTFFDQTDTQQTASLDNSTRTAERLMLNQRMRPEVVPQIVPEFHGMNRKTAGKIPAVPRHAL